MLTYEIIGFVKTFSCRNHTWLLFTSLLLFVVLSPLALGPVLPIRWAHIIKLAHEETQGIFLDGTLNAHNGRAVPVLAMSSFISCLRPFSTMLPLTHLTVPPPVCRLEDSFLLSLSGSFYCLGSTEVVGLSRC